MTVINTRCVHQRKDDQADSTSMDGLNSEHKVGYVIKRDKWKVSVHYHSPSHFFPYLSSTLPSLPFYSRTSYTAANCSLVSNNVTAGNATHLPILRILQGPNRPTASTNVRYRDVPTSSWVSLAFNVVLQGVEFGSRRFTPKSHPRRRPIRRANRQNSLENLT